MENKWQKHYRENIYDGRLPQWGVGREEYDLLGDIGDTVTVCFPAGEDTFRVTFEDCDIPNGVISVQVLSSNLRLWSERGHEIRSE